MKSFDDFLATFDESTGKESIEGFCTIAKANKDSLTDEEKVMFLAILASTEICRKKNPATGSCV